MDAVVIAFTLTESDLRLLRSYVTIAGISTNNLEPNNRGNPLRFISSPKNIEIGMSHFKH